MIYDYVLVGQGIAGTILTHFLSKKGKRIAIVDANHQQSSSMVAAGLVNPITGRRFVKSWLVDELIPFAKQTYQALEEELGITIFESKEIARIFNATKVQNDWLVRSAEQDVQNYIEPDFEQDFYTNFLKGVEGGVEFNQSARVRLKDLILTYQQKLQKETLYLQERFDYSQLEIGSDTITYKAIVAKRIIFCEGYQAMQNPYFNYLPFWPVKGEVLLVRIKDYPANHKLVKHGVFIVHWEEDLYWIGSTYDKKFDHTAPTPQGRENLEQRLSDVLKIPFEIVEHQAAIRPTVRDRKPYLGQHPRYKNLYIFNGMGAKGSYLVPHFAREMVNYLEEDKILDKEVDIKRVEKRGFSFENPL